MDRDGAVARYEKLVAASGQAQADDQEEEVVGVAEVRALL
jgi:hypothetical protein